MKTFILTFGQKNSAFKHGFVEIEAEDEVSARGLAFQTFGSFWSNVYPKEVFEEKGYGELFPDGKLGRSLV